MNENKISSHELSKLKWRARRGMLENDIILSKFFNANPNLNILEAKSLEILMALSDNELLDLILNKIDLSQTEIIKLKPNIADKKNAESIAIISMLEKLKKQM
jgi:antitoxin CptB